MDHNSITNMQDNHSHGKLIIQCPACKQKLRIPSNRIQLEITCTSCRNIWIWSNPVSETFSDFNSPSSNRNKINSHDSNEELIKEIKEKITKIRSYTPKVGIFGNSGVGKSSLCNALFGKEIAKISDVSACTRKPQEILIGSQNGGIILLDVPGIGEDPHHQKEYTELYKSLAPQLDLVLWAIKADDRNYASAIDTYKAVFNSKNPSPPVLFVITQTDKTNDVEDWNNQEYTPGETQITNIISKEHDVSKRFNITTKNIVSIAVSKRGKSYNITKLVDAIVEILPNEKKFSFTRETKKENVSKEAHTSAEEGIFETIKKYAGIAWDAIKDDAVSMLLASAPPALRKFGNLLWGKFSKNF